MYWVSSRGDFSIGVTTRLMQLNGWEHFSVALMPLQKLHMQLTAGVCHD
jgi:hypothetical protein